MALVAQPAEIMQLVTPLTQCQMCGGNLHDEASDDYSRLYYPPPQTSRETLEVTLAEVNPWHGNAEVNP